jgi:hypothetical protein
MTQRNSSAVGALDQFFSVIRQKAAHDPDFAASLISALNIPFEIVIETPADVKSKMLYLDPYVIAAKGYEQFRGVYGQLKDPQKKAIIKYYDIADLPTGRGAPKGEELVDILWQGAQSKRKRLGL